MRSGSCVSAVARSWLVVAGGWLMEEVALPALTGLGLSLVGVGFVLGFVFSLVRAVFFGERG